MVVSPVLLKTGEGHGTGAVARCVAEGNLGAAPSLGATCCKTRYPPGGVYLGLSATHRGRYMPNSRGTGSRKSTPAGAYVNTA